MSFAGLSLIRDGKLCPGALAINDAGSASEYHLLVVEGYSRTKADVLTGKYIQSRPFRVGGYLWFLRYYPNGWHSDYTNFISAAVVLAQDVAMPVKVKYRFSFINQADKQEPSDIRANVVSDFPKEYVGKGTADYIRRGVLENSEHLKEDRFTIRCDIVVEDVNAKTKSAASLFVTVPPTDMQRHFADLLVANEGTDVMFKVGAETINAHRCVLAARSRVFRAELFGPMKEGTATASAILVEDMDTQSVQKYAVVHYSDSVPELRKEDDDVMWQHLLAAADRYDIQRLKLMCEEKLCGFIDVSTTPAILALAERHGCDRLKKACYDFLVAPGNAKAVVATDGFDHLITSAPSVVKELIVIFVP